MIAAPPAATPTALAGTVHPEIARIVREAPDALAPQAFSELLARLERPLRHLFRTTRPVLPAHSAAQGMMEAAVRNGVDERMLAVIGGAAGEEFARVAEACGKEVVRAFVRPGETIEARHLARFLEGPGVDAVAVAHVEPASGAVAPLEELARVARAADDVLLFVDARWSLAGERLEMDLWQLDFVLAGGEGALGLPAGLSLAAASKRLAERAGGRNDRGWYFDLVRLEREVRARTLTIPPAVPLLLALERQLRRIEDRGGIEARWEEHAARAAIVARWVEAHPAFRLLAGPGRRSATVSCIAHAGASGTPGTAVPHFGDAPPDSLAEALERLEQGRDAVSM